MKRIIITLLLLVTLSACQDVEYSIHLQNGKDVVFESETWIDKGCTITINNEDYEMVRRDEVDYTIYESQVITYTYTHKKEEYVCKRTVLVLEEVDFQITLAPGLDTVQLNSTHIDKGLVFENKNADEFLVVVKSDVNTTKLGTYTITYTIYDQTGRVLTMYRKVNVVN